MYKILIADDEGIMLESLKNIIETNFGEDCQLAFAKTGRGVIEQEESFRPDIILLDIQMPGLSGIQAMREIRKSNPYVLFTVISAYYKFNHAKEAIELGAVKFLTKPVNKRVIIDVLLKMMRQVDETRQKRSEDLRIKEKLEIVVPMIESGFIYNILLQDELKSVHDSYYELLGIETNYGFMIVIEFGDEMKDGAMTNVIGASVRVNAMYPEIREIVRDFFQATIGPIMGNHIVAFVAWEQEGLTYEQRVEHLNKTRNFVCKLKQRTANNVRAAIGSVQDIRNLKKSYLEALKALRESDGHAIHVEDGILENRENKKSFNQLENKYFQSVRKGDVLGAGNIAGEILNMLQEEELENVWLKAFEMLMRVNHEIYMLGKGDSDFEQSKSFLQEVRSLKKKEEVLSWFVEKTRVACHHMSDKLEENAGGGIISKAMHYIGENFSKDLSLEEVSRFVDISPYYFSKLFKKEAGENFIEYLTRARIKNARDLLNETEKSIKEVCVLSGYRDPNYFSRIFKKVEGVTPSEYREIVGGRA
jgi:Response regulator containing CheY-like receiver domain and AraC-type DNA-binding domain